MSDADVAETYPSGDSLVLESRLSVWIIVLTLAASAWSTALVELFAASLIAVFLFFRARNPSRLAMGLARLPVLCWVVYVIVVVASVVASPLAQGSTGYFNKLWHAMLFPAAYTMPLSARHVRIIGRFFAVSMSCSALVSIIMYFTGQSAYASSPFVGETTFMALVVIAALLVAASATMTEREDPMHWPMHLMAGIPLVLAAFFSTQRLPVVTLIIGVAIVLAVSQPKRLVAWAMVIALLFFLSPGVLWLKLVWTAGGHLDDRSIVWTEGIRLIAHLPLLGYGPDSYVRILPAETAFLNRQPVSWHNDLMQTVLESGWIAGLAYAGLVGSVCIGAARATAQAWNVAERNRHIVACLVIGTLFCFSMVSVIVSTTVLGVVYWIVLGLTGNFIRKDFQNEFLQEQ